MSAELIGILAVGGGLLASMIGLVTWVRHDIGSVETRLTRRIDRLEDRFDNVFGHWLKPPTATMPESEPVVMPAERG